MVVNKNGKSQDISEPHARSASPRICMPTWRNFARRVYQCSFYEAQDVLQEIDDVDLIYPDRGLNMTWRAEFKRAWLKNPLYSDVSRMLMRAEIGFKKVQLKRDYDVFIAVFDHSCDLPYINAIERWRDHCKIALCWIGEMWAADVPQYKHWLHLLAQFDYIFLNNRGTARILSQATKRPCYWLPGGINALRFSPFPDPPARIIDIYSIGRRYEGLHREMLEASARGELFYVHDTLANAADTEVRDHQQHRDLFASIAKRSRYFTVAPAKMDVLDETGGQVEVGFRYYEGAAAGTVMIGTVPDCEAFRELFGWPEAVIKVRPDGSDIRAVLRDLDSNPERVAAIGRRNAKEALLRHDWGYRWNEMFQVAGIKAPRRMAARERHLKKMADFVAAGADENGAVTTRQRIRPC